MWHMDLVKPPDTKPLEKIKMHSGSALSEQS